MQKSTKPNANVLSIDIKNRFEQNTHTANSISILTSSEINNRICSINKDQKKTKS